MAHSTTPASASVDIKKERLSFAKIAAAGIKPPNALQNPNTNSHNNHNQDITSTPRAGDAIVTPSNSTAQPAVAVPKPKKLIQLQSKDTKDTLNHSSNGPEVRVQIVDSAPSRAEPPAPDGFLVPTASDDAGTQVSSSSDSNKPPSVDGKSVASGTTFALDEKESLRPDDSASVKAAEEEDMYSASGSGMPSRVGSDDGVRAFRDQLREISAMEPSRRGGPPPTFAAATRGVLYVPPQGPGIGAVPSPARGVPTLNPNVDFPPDPKLLEALENPRDRVWVLKLEQDVIDFVKDNKESSLILPQCHSFYRLLAHKMAEYYMLAHHIEDATCPNSAVRLYKTPNCRIPPPLTGVTAPSTAASTPPPTAPAMKILRRGVDGPAIANGSNIPSKSASEAGDSGDEKKKAPVTREEREARYEAARLRIMGSAKPTDSPETPKEKQDSRSSSATGKKSKKKAREDNDDGFEARSAYSNYYNASFGSEGIATPPYGYPSAESAPNQYSMPFGQPTHGASYQSTPMQGHAHSAWAQQPYNYVDPTQAWAQSQSGAYDLSADFQRNMSFQSTMSPQPTNLGFGQTYSQGYPQQYYAPQQGWQPQQPYSMPTQAAQPGYGYGQVGPINVHSAPNPQTQDPTQPYAFGQLPSQTVGRPPSKNEHPLPGSYKGKNFNPQSQAFVPGQADGRSFSPYGSPVAQVGFGQPMPAQPPQLSRHSSAQSQGSSFPSPHQSQPQTPQHRMPGQPLTHPLPHGPVFPRQPSPNVPLPPKPGSMQPLPNVQQPSTSPSAHVAAQNQSILAKWGAPSSLPAKPPPANEPFDSAKITQIQRQPFNAAAAARQQAGYPVRM
ncbi:hypothetical protein AC578_1935 [Pseudocercospora eumusae]|uniref:SUZ domain-containing protein n=1 Tax=Pseudocercospora eumusae TaxID=321146 RepID=A0A139HDF4_9PEZI|nr:hypothetical protein AC578_1935 [Pseudocercospora eumusae]